MKRFFRGLLTGLNVLLIACLLLCSLLFAYLAITGQATLFGYTVSLIDMDGVSLTLTAKDMPRIEAGDLILCRGADGTVSVQSTAYASDSAVYFYDADGSLGAVPLTGPEFAGKLLWQGRTAGRILQLIAKPPAKWILLGAMGVLLIGCVIALTANIVRRRRTMLAGQAEKDAQLLKAFSISKTTSSIIRTELLSAEDIELTEEEPEEKGLDKPPLDETSAAAADHTEEPEKRKEECDLQEKTSPEERKEPVKQADGSPQPSKTKTQAEETGSLTVDEILESMRKELTRHE